LQDGRAFRAARQLGSVTVLARRCREVDRPLIDLKRNRYYSVRESSGGMSVTLTLIIGAVGFALGYSVREFISRRRRRAERRRRAMGL
jgi:hypothetical protein